MAVSEERGNEIYSTLVKHSADMLEIAGVDVKRLRARQEETAGKMAEIAERIGTEFRDAAPAIAEEHRRALIAYDSYDSSASSRRPDRFPLCLPVGCSHYADLCDNSVELIPPGDEAHAKGSATCDLALNICRPRLELHGGGAGVPVSGKVNCWLVFGYPATHDPCMSGTYSIKAFTQASGYRFLQVWSCGCGGPVSSGHLSLKAKLSVSQLGVELCSTDYTLLDATGGSPLGGAVEINRFISCSADLDAEHETVIKVEFEIDAGIDGCGQCYVDLQTSDFFYFMVPYVGIYRCYPWLGRLAYGRARLEGDLPYGPVMSQEE